MVLALGDRDARTLSTCEISESTGSAKKAASEEKARRTVILRLCAMGAVLFVFDIWASCNGSFEDKSGCGSVALKKRP